MSFPAKSLRVIRLAGTAAIVALFGAALCPALGDVIDVAPDGATTVYNAPAIFRSNGVQEIGAGRRSLAYAKAAKVPSGAVRAMLSYAADRYAINAPLLQNVAWQESRFHDAAVSPKGAVGVMQLMPGTAHDLGVDRYDPWQNILGGAAYLRQMLDRYGGNQGLALAAYNAGPSAVDRYRGVPPYLETQNYIKNIGTAFTASVQLSSPSVIFIDP